MTPIRFVRSPDGLTLRARPTLVSLQSHMPPANTLNTYQGSKVTNVTISQGSHVQQQPQQIQRLTFQQLTPQQQQLLLQRKLTQKAILISQQQQELNNSANQDPLAVQQRQLQLAQHRQMLLQQIDQIQKQMNDGQNQQQRQILVQQAVPANQDGKADLSPQQRQQIVIQRQNIILQQQQFQQLQQQNVPQQQQQQQVLQSQNNQNQLQLQSQNNQNTIQVQQQQQQQQQNPGQNNMTQQQKLFQHQQLQLQIAKQQHIMAQHNAQIQQKLVQRSPQQQNVIQSQLSPQQQQTVLLQQTIKQEPGEIVNPNVIRQQQQQQQQLLLQRQQQQTRFLQQQLISQGKVTRQMVQSQQQSPIPPQSPNQPPLSPMPPQSPISNNQQYCQPNSPMISTQSPMLSQSPQQFSQPVQSPNSVQYTPNSPMPSQSPRQTQFVQPTSPLMPQSPMVQGYTHPPATSPFGQPPSSPSPRPSQSPRNSLGPPSSPMSPMQQNPYIRPTTSPMPARRPVGNSPLMPDQQELREENNVPPEGYQYAKLGLRGGRHYCLPPKGFKYTKLGLKGGAPMWSTGRQFVSKDAQDEVKRSVFKSNDMPLSAIPVSKVSSLVSLEYGDSDDEGSRTPPVPSPQPPPIQISKQKEAPEGINTDPMIISASSKNDDNRNLPVYKDVNLSENCKKDSIEDLDAIQMISTIHMNMDPGQISLNSSRVGEELLDMDREINSPGLMLNENDDSILGGLPKDEASEMDRLMFFDELGDSIKCDQEEKSESPEKSVFNLDKLLNDPEPHMEQSEELKAEKFLAEFSQENEEEKIDNVIQSYSFHSYAKVPRPAPSPKRENRLVSILKTDQSDDLKKVTNLLRSHPSTQNKNIIILNPLSDSLKDQQVKQNLLLSKSSDNLKHSDLAQILSNIMSPKQKDGFIKIETTKSDEHTKHSTIVLPARTTSVVHSSQNFPWESITAFTTASSTSYAKSIQIISKPENKELKNSSQLSCMVNIPKQEARTPKVVEESQNVLLKQLLQNTACANQTPTTTTAISLPIIPSLEAQLARPVSPTPSLLFPSLLSPKKDDKSESQHQLLKPVKPIKLEIEPLAQRPEPQPQILKKPELHIQVQKSESQPQVLKLEPQSSPKPVVIIQRSDIQTPVTQTPSTPQPPPQPTLLQVQPQQLKLQPQQQPKLQPQPQSQPQMQSTRSVATSDSIMESINSAIKQERLEEENKNEVHAPVTLSPEREVKREIMSSDELVSPQNSTRVIDPADINNSMNMSMDMNADTQGKFFIFTQYHFIRS